MTSRLEKALKRLPDDLQDEVAAFAEFLTLRQQAHPGEPPDSEPEPSTSRRANNSETEVVGAPENRFSWMGKLKPAYPDETGVDLAHAALKWRADKSEGRER